MKKQMWGTPVAIIIVICLLFAPYIINAYKFSQCDFKLSDDADLKCEMIHGLGLIPPLQWVTMWFGTDAE